LLADTAIDSQHRATYEDKPPAPGAQDARV